MSEFIKDIDKDLGTIISKKMHMQPVLAEKWSWKILNEYPRNSYVVSSKVFFPTGGGAIRKWAKDEQIPEIEYSRISLEMAMQGIGLDILEAVDLLYITSKDPLHGYEIFTRFARR